MPEKILLVDEQLYMLRLIQHHLEKAGYELIQARNPEEARLAVTQENPSLVVGEARAIETAVKPVLEELKPGVAPIPVIRMSDVPPALDQPASEHETEITMQKPFSPTKLLAAIQQMIPREAPEGT